MGGGARLSVAVWAFQHVGSRVCGTAQAGLVSIRFDVVLSGMPNKKSSDSGSSEEYSYVPEDVDVGGKAKGKGGCAAEEVDGKGKGPKGCGVGKGQASPVVGAVAKSLPKGRVRSPRRASSSEERRRRTPSAHRGGGRGRSRPARRASPEATRGKGLQRCNICWKRVRRNSSDAGLSQHQYWSEACNSWRLWYSGIPWREARRQAAELKKEREDDEHGYMWEEAGGGDYRRKAEHVTPAASRRHREELDALRRQEEAAMAEGMEEAPRDRRKTKKRRRERKSSPTPEVTRGRKGPRTPPGSSDGEDAAFKVRRGPGRSFIVSF